MAGKITYRGMTDLVIWHLGGFTCVLAFWENRSFDYMNLKRHSFAVSEYSIVTNSNTQWALGSDIPGSKRMHHTNSPFCPLKSFEALFIVQLRSLSHGCLSTLRTSF